MWLKGAELHPEEAKGGAGLGGGMNWYASYTLAGTWKNEQLGELLGKVAEAASMDKFERPEKMENRGKNASIHLSQI